MSTTLSDVRILTRDFIGQYSTGSAKEDQVDRAINRAIERIKREIGMPADEDIHTFWYTQDKLFYNLPSTFREGLYVQYNSKNANTLGNVWDYLDYPTVLQKAGGDRDNHWSFTHINGKKQLVMVGYNGHQGRTLLDCDTAENTAASGDASNLTVDEITKVQGSASLNFDITDSSGTATITFTSLNIDLEDLFDKNGFLKLWVYMTDNDIDDVTIKVQSSSGNYYNIIATQNDDGVDFVQDEWQKIAWDTSDKVAIGSPDLNNITEIAVSFGLGTGFTSAVDFRIDDLFSAYAEKMDFVYYTNAKGTDSSGTAKDTLDAPDDILYFSGDYDEYTTLIAQRAAIYLWPQLRGSIEHYQLLRQEHRSELKVFARAYPRKRKQGQFRHTLRR